MDDKEFVKGLYEMLNGMADALMDKKARETGKDLAEHIIESVREGADGSVEFRKRQVILYSELISCLEKEVERVGLDGGIEVKSADDK